MAIFTVANLTDINLLNTPSGTIGNVNSIYSDNGAIIQRVSDRLFIGAASIVTSGDSTNTTKNWLSSLTNLAYTSKYGQQIVLSTIGGPALISGSRTSDFESAFGSYSTGCIGISGYGINDDTIGAFPSVWGGYFEARRNSGVGGRTQGVEIESANFGTTVDISPVSVPAGATISVALGAGAATATNPSSAALFISDNSAKFRKGIVTLISALDTTIGAGGGGVMMEIPANASLRWIKNNGGSPVVVGELWADATLSNLVTPQSIFSQATPSPWIYSNANSRTQSIGSDGFNLNVGSLGGGTLNLQVGVSSLTTVIQANTATPASAATGMFLLVNNNGGVNLAAVTLGAADSGGTGFRLLRVAN